MTLRSYASQYSNVTFFAKILTNALTNKETKFAFDFEKTNIKLNVQLLSHEVKWSLSHIAVLNNIVVWRTLKFFQ